MKKSLSVILSTTMALSFSTAAFAAATSSSDFSDLSKLSAADKVIFDKLIKDGIFLGKGEGKFGVEDNMKRSEFAVAISKALKLTADAKTSSFADVAADAPELPYIEAAYKAKVANGNTGTPLTFSPADEVTREQLAVFLVGALGADAKKEAEGAKGTDKTVSDWAQGYVATALKYKLLTAKEDGTFAGTDKATRYTLAKGVAATQAAIASKGVATKVEAVTADNLKEIVVKFDGNVDKATAQDKNNYSTTAGAIASASLNADGNTVTLTLGKETNGVEINMKNQKSYKVSVTNVKAGDRVINQSEVVFSPLDNTLPTVESVVALGTSALKVVFSEPVKAATSSNFKVDDKYFNGSVTVSGREVVLRAFDSTTLAVGAHKLTTSLVEDYAGLKSLATSSDFTVVEDKEGPVASEITATLETVTITFNEDIDTNTVSADDVYWMSGTSKKKASKFTKISGNKYQFEFTGTNVIPAYATTLYIDSVSDYSGNANTVKEYQIQATVDQTRPEVSEVKFDASSADTLIVRYNKNVSADDRKFYTLTDKNGDVVGISSVLAVDSKTFAIKLYKNLPTGKNTLKIAGVQDTTTLHNTMLSYETTVNVSDLDSPKIADVTASSNATNNTVVISFGKKMDAATLQNPSNYTIFFKGKTRQLPSDVNIQVLQDGKAVQLAFPDYIGNDAVTIGKTINNGSLQTITVMGVKDVAGNVLDKYSVTVDVQEANAKTAPFSATYGSKNARTTDDTTILVKFDQPIGYARTNDFEVTVNGGAPVRIESVTTDGTSVVTIKTRDSIGTDAAAINVATIVGNYIKTTNGNQVNAEPSISLYDGVAPVVSVSSTTRLEQAGGVITLPFSEKLDGTAAAQFGNDLQVIDRSNPNEPLKAGTDYTTRLAANGKDIEIVLTTQSATTDYAVKVKSGAKYIQDITRNDQYAAESANYEVKRNAAATVQAPVLSPAKSGDTQINGRAVANADVEAFFNGASIGTAKADSAGTFTINTNAPLVAGGTYSVKASVNGVTSAAATVVATASSAKAITSFNIDAAVGVVNETAKTITVVVPMGSDLTKLNAPVIVASNKATVAPTVSVDFTAPVKYTVTAEDGTTVQYTVTVTVATA
ncbi:S-layer homology domain-containing protein [Paenibacillus sp. KN14-4R]|uniref:S-layer homology domain-containing protein n=1 Tax=Paenibacillus sp. KN14-4R TaxID=3445773 RepID=UPI003F9FC7F4